MPRSGPLLDARAITVDAPGRDGPRIVDGASIALAEASVVTVRGASGSGKSTLLRAIATLVPLTSGTLSFDGQPVEAVGMTTYRRLVSYVPQTPRMFEGSVAENVRTGPRFRGIELDDDAVVALLARVGLPESLAGRSASDVSGGERLRVALARALANEPRVLLLDEPTASLDEAAAGVVLAQLVALARAGTALLVVTHVDAHAERLGGTHHRMVSGVLARDEVA